MTTIKWNFECYSKSKNDFLFSRLPLWFSYMHTNQPTKKSYWNRKNLILYSKRHQNYHREWITCILCLLLNFFFRVFATRSRTQSSLCILWQKFNLNIYCICKNIRYCYLKSMDFFVCVTRCLETVSAQIIHISESLQTFILISRNISSLWNSSRLHVYECVPCVMCICVCMWLHQLIKP